MKKRLRLIIRTHGLIFVLSYVAIALPAFLTMAVTHERKTVLAVVLITFVLLLLPLRRMSVSIKTKVLKEIFIVGYDDAMIYASVFVRHDMRILLNSTIAYSYCDDESAIKYAVKLLESNTRTDVKLGGANILCKILFEKNDTENLKRLYNHCELLINESTNAEVLRKKFLFVNIYRNYLYGNMTQAIKDSRAIIQNRNKETNASNSLYPTDINLTLAVLLLRNGETDEAKQHLEFIMEKGHSVRTRKTAADLLKSVEFENN